MATDENQSLKVNTSVINLLLLQCTSCLYINYLFLFQSISKQSFDVLASPDAFIKLVSLIQFVSYNSLNIYFKTRKSLNVHIPMIKKTVDLQIIS